jgi:hypothetical protein
MQGLMHLLEQALARSQWREAFGAPQAVEDASSADDDVTARKPRYLN